VKEAFRYSGRRAAAARSRQRENSPGGRVTRDGDTPSSGTRSALEQTSGPRRAAWSYGYDDADRLVEVRTRRARSAPRLRRLRAPRRLPPRQRESPSRLGGAARATSAGRRAATTRVYADDAYTPLSGAGRPVEARRPTARRPPWFYLGATAARARSISHVGRGRGGEAHGHAPLRGPARGREPGSRTSATATTRPGSAVSSRRIRWASRALYDVGSSNATLYLDPLGSSSSWPATTTRSSRRPHRSRSRGSASCTIRTPRPQPRRRRSRRADDHGAPGRIQLGSRVTTGTRWAAPPSTRASRRLERPDGGVQRRHGAGGRSPSVGRDRPRDRAVRSRGRADPASTHSTPVRCR